MDLAWATNSWKASSLVGFGFWFSSIVPYTCIFAHRRVACNANLGGGSAQFDDATDEIEDDLVDREPTSEIIDSGEETDETEQANEER